MEYLMRPELNDDYQILKLQNTILNIAKYLDGFCEENKIEYCLMSGSALGAIRHQGFIPWDDDLDVFMRPKEYARFRKLFIEKGNTKDYYLQEWGACNGMVSIAKLRLNKSMLIEKDIENWDINHGVYIDIFILHTCPDNKLKRYNQVFWAKYLVTKGAANRGYKKSGFKGFAINLCKVLPKRFLLKFALSQVYKYDNNESQYYCHFMGRPGLKHGLYKREYFKSNKRVPFETITLKVNENIEQYMHDRWGDYMKLPTTDEIKKFHHSWKWSDSEYFPGYKENGEYKDEKYLLA